MMITDVYTNFAIARAYKEGKLFLHLQITSENSGYTIMIEPESGKHPMHIIDYDVMNNSSIINSRQLLEWFYDDGLVNDMEVT